MTARLFVNGGLDGELILRLSFLSLCVAAVHSAGGDNHRGLHGVASVHGCSSLRPLLQRRPALPLVLSFSLSSLGGTLHEVGQRMVGILVSSGY